MTYRDDVEALAARKAALDAELNVKKRERDDAARLLAEALVRSRLPVLPNIRIASPCKAPWDEMTGDDRVRHCAACDKDVFNLSALTRQQAESLIVEKKGDLCARYYQRKDGTILLADCEVGRRRQQRGYVIAAGMVVTITAGVGVFALRSTPEPRDETVGALELPVHQGKYETETGMPGCDNWRREAIDLQDCQGLPAESRASVLAAYNEASAGWSALPADVRATVDAGCASAAAALHELHAKMCGSPLQSPQAYESQRAGRGDSNE